MKEAFGYEGVPTPKIKVLYVPEKVDFGAGMKWEECNEIMKRNNAQLGFLDNDARDNNRLVGRVIYHPYADGYATYQVIKETVKSVRIRVCTGLGDDWVLPAWGREVTIPKTKALDFIGRRDALARLFMKRP